MRYHCLLIGETGSKFSSLSMVNIIESMASQRTKDGLRNAIWDDDLERVQSLLTKFPEMLR